MVALAVLHHDEQESFVWEEFALCRGLAYYFNPEENPFFPEGQGVTYEIVRPYCAACPVVVDCLLDVIDDRSAIGFWGATSPNERASIRRHMDNGVDFVKATERIWSRNRRKKIPVPSKTVWKDWE